MFIQDIFPNIAQLSCVFFGIEEHANAKKNKYEKFF